MCTCLDAAVWRPVGNHDFGDGLVQMSEFLALVNVAEARERLFEALATQDLPRELETVPTEEALDRVLAEAVVAPEKLPPFRRSTVDGFAVRAADTFGASASLPAYLELVGEVPMGAAANFGLEKGQAAVVHTGGMLPAGADAVVMLEDTQHPAEDEIEVLRSVASAENVLQAGEDLEIGGQALEAGRRLRPQELGGLAALGITEVKVARRPRVALIATGDEIVEPSAALAPGQVRDVNTTTLSALVASLGGEPVARGIVPDDYDQLLATARDSLATCDAVVITAGSSVSARDRTAEVLDELGDPGVLVHGVSIKPGKPTILAVCDGKLAMGLPGNPVSALVVAGIFLAPAIRILSGQRGPALHAEQSARLAVNVASKSGREDFLPVRLEASEEGWIAQPVYGRSNLIFTLIRADGLVRIPPESTGLPEGSSVRVQLLN